MCSKGAKHKYFERVSKNEEFHTHLKTVVKIPKIKLTDTVPKKLCQQKKICIFNVFTHDHKSIFMGPTGTFRADWIRKKRERGTQG